MTMPNKPDQPEQPRREPEIIPPGKDAPPRDSNWPRYGYSENRGTHRIYVGRIGPLGFAIVLLMAALFGGVLVLALIGAVLIWFPIVAVLAIIGAIAAIIRRL
jgi:hypothetical protein